jgi:phosphoserine phosphatase
MNTRYFALIALAAGCSVEQAALTDGDGGPQPGDLPEAAVPSGNAGGGTEGDSRDPGAEADLVRPDCGSPDAGSAEEWEHSFLTPLVQKLGDALHSASDSVVNPGVEGTLRGKFSYGPTSKDLEDERIRAFVAIDCQWRELGSQFTDTDGRVAIPVSAAHFPETGAYPFRLLVAGDLTYAQGSVFVVTRGTPTVVFDIDGTLTTDDKEMVRGGIAEILRPTGSDVLEYAGLDEKAFDIAVELIDEHAEAYEGAQDVVRYWIDRGYQPIYITARPYLFDPLTRDWLDTMGFPHAPVFTLDSVEQALEGAEGALPYKVETLDTLIEDAGLDIQYAYGNATSDICAYAEVGIDPAATHIIGQYAGAACAGYENTVPVTDYSSHLDALP